MGIVLGGRGRKRRRIGRADGRSINVYTMHPIRILSQAAFFGGLPRFRFTGRSEVPPSPAFSGEAGLGFFGGLPLLRFAGGSPVEVSSWVFLGLGGLPLFLFSPAAGEASGADADASAGLFLFLLPLGRPRPRFTGEDGAPK
jgi:hypothetical protein